MWANVGLSGPQLENTLLTHNMGIFDHIQVLTENPHALTPTVGGAMVGLQDADIASFLLMSLTCTGSVVSKSLIIFAQFLKVKYCI